MSATGRFGYSMGLAALLAGVGVATVEQQKRAVLVAVAARNRLPLGHLVGWAWVGITLALGLVFFILSSLATRGRGQVQGNRSSGFYPAPARSGRRSGRR